MPPELHIISLIIAILAVAYLGIYPRMEPKTLARLMRIDMALGVVTLAIAGSVYLNTGTRFSLGLFAVPWWLFTIIMAFLIELPLFLWFCRKWGIDLNDLDGK